jgi:hypothetical protein
MVKLHEQNTGQEVKTAVADSRYGTIESYLFCQGAGIEAHIHSLEERQKDSGRREDIFPKEAFVYHPQTDTFTCPVGRELRRRHFYQSRRHYEYQTASGLCDRCSLRPKCTRSRSGRTLKRHERQWELDQILEESQSAAAKKDIQTRQHLSERSFARSTRYGFKRARWRRLWRVPIQDFLVTTVQNIVVFIRYALGKLSKSNAPFAENLKNLGLIKERILEMGVYLFDLWLPN